MLFLRPEACIHLQDVLVVIFIGWYLTPLDVVDSLLERSSSKFLKLTRKFYQGQPTVRLFPNG
jgi:hypothetical protein